jgi:hypothetical protein
MLGLLRAGEQRETSLENAGSLETWICDLSTDRPVFTVIRPPALTQSIELISRGAGRGQRWCFRESGTGIICEAVYAFEGRYVSRKNAGFAYKSQLSRARTRGPTNERSAEQLGFSIPPPCAAVQKEMETRSDVDREIERLTKILKRASEKKTRSTA